MTIAVVVTNYNHGEFIGDALGSLKVQTLRPDEVIVVDDGSRIPPRREFIMKHLGWSNGVKVIYTAKNQGTGAALNKAISVMKSDVLCWLPADDTWYARKLEKQAAFAKDHPGCVLHSASDVMDCRMSAVYVADVCPPELTDTEFAEAIRTSSPYFANTFWIPQDILRTVGPFREDLPVSEDYEWVLRSVVQHGIKYRLQRDVLTVNRMHANATAERHGDKVPAVMRQVNIELGG